MPKLSWDSPESEIQKARVAAHRHAMKTDPEYRKVVEDYLEQKETPARVLRLREIWAAIREYDRLHSAGKHRVRGIGHAAARAGF